MKRFEAGDYRSFDQAMRDLEAERRGVRPAPAVAQTPSAPAQNLGSLQDRNTLWTTQAEINEVLADARKINIQIDQAKSNYDVLMRHNNTVLANQQKEEAQKLQEELVALKMRHDSLKTVADALTQKGIQPLQPEEKQTAQPRQIVTPVTEARSTTVETTTRGTNTGGSPAKTPSDENNAVRTTANATAPYRLSNTDRTY